MSNNDDFQQGVHLLTKWYSDEINSLCDSAIEACHGKLLPPFDEVMLNAGIPATHWESARLSNPERRYRERDEGTDPREFLTDWVDQTTNGHEFVIYTFKAQAALLVSGNSGAWDDEGMGGTPSDEARACVAMCADMWEQLVRRSSEWDLETVDE